MPENPCIEILKNAYPELHKYLEDKARIFDKAKKESWINAARDLQHDTLDNLHNIYNQVGVKGFEKPIEKVQVPTEEQLKDAEQIQSIDDAENRLSNGERIFAVPEMDQQPIEVTSVETLRNYAPDQLLASKPKEEPFTVKKRSLEKQRSARKVYEDIGEIDDPKDARGMALQYLAGGGKINEKSINDIAGTVKRASLNTGKKEKKSSEVKARDYSSKDAPTIEKVAHSIWDNLPEDLKDSISDQDIRNELNDVIISHNKRLSAAIEFRDRYIGKESERDLTEDEAKEIDEISRNKLLKIASDIPEERQESVVKTLKEYQDQYGNVDWERLDKDFEGFDPELLSLPEQTIKDLDGLVKKHIEQGQGESRNADVENIPSQEKTSQKANAPPEERLKTAQSAYDKAARELKSAEDKISGKQATQQSILPDQGAQKEMFGVGRDEAKDILDPLRLKVKEAKIELEAAQKDAEIAGTAQQELPIKKAGDAARNLAEKIRSGKINKLGGFKSSTGFDAVWDGSLEIIAKTIEGGAKIADAIEAGLKYIRGTDWYKSLNDKKEFEDKYRSHLQSEFGGEKENKPAEKPRIRVTAEELERAQPPKEEFEFTEGGEGTGIAHAATEEVRAKYGLGEYERNNATDAELEQAAEEEIAKGYNPEIVIAQMERGVPPSGIENFILKKYLATLQAQFEKNPTDTNLEKIHRLVRATDKIGSLQSEAFRTRRGLTPVEDSRAEFFITELATNNDAPLTENQKKIANEDFDRLSEARKKLDEDQKSLEEKVAAFKAEQELGKIKKKISSSSKKTHEAIVKEREEILKSIKEKWKNAGKDILSSDIPYRAQVFAIAPDVIKLARNLVEDGILKLEEIGKNIHGILKDDASDLTEKDIHDIIAGEYSEKNVTKKEVAIRLENLRQQAALVNKLERSESGRTKTDKQERKKNQEIATFKKQLGIDKLEQLIALKSRIHTQTGKLLEKLNKGDFRPEVKKVPLLEDMELKKRFPELFKQTQKSLDQYIKVKHEIAIRRATQLYEDKSTDEKIIEVLSKSLNVPRTLMASFDFSAPLRQGLVAFSGHPLIASKALKFMFEAAKDEKVYNRWLEEVHNSPHWKWAEKSGLGITDPESLHVIKAEEAFQGAQYAEKIPLLGGPIKLPLIRDGKVEWTEKKYGGFVKASERAYIGFLNKMRWDLFEMYANRFEDQGKTYENNKRLYEGISSLINSETGRGGISKGLEKYSPIFNALLFSSKLMASRLNMLGLTDIPNLVIRGATFGKYGVDYGFYTRLPKELRIDAAKDMLKFLGVGISTLALIKGASYLTDDDVEIEIDPRSSDFGKVRVGKQRWDIWGGFQPYARVLTQVITAQRKTTTTGQIQELNGEGFMKQTRWTPLVSFFRSKAAPVPGSAINLATGTDVVGQPVTIQGELLKSVTPLLFQDTYQAMKDQGVKAIFTVGVPAAFGIGVQTFNKPKK